MKLRWLRRANASLEDSADRIAEHDLDAAARFVSRIRSAADSLRQHPHLGRPGRVAGTRELVVTGTNYLLPYRVVADEVQILHVLHGAQL